MERSLEYFVNNGQTIRITQKDADGAAVVRRYDGDKEVNEKLIPAGDMVMLLNLYEYIKKNDIQNDFINPGGKNKEV